MAGLNRTEIIGKLGKDPEMRYTPSGKPTASFSVAVPRYVKTDTGGKQETEWFNVVTWNKQAELCNQYLHKGSLVYLAGRIQTHSWEGNDGQKHYKTELIVNEVVFLDKKDSKTTEQVDNEELPF